MGSRGDDTHVLCTGERGKVGAAGTDSENMKKVTANNSDDTLEDTVSKRPN